MKSGATFTRYGKKCIPSIVGKGGRNVCVHAAKYVALCSYLSSVPFSLLLFLYLLISGYQPARVKTGASVRNWPLIQLPSSQIRPIHRRSISALMPIDTWISSRTWNWATGWREHRRLIRAAATLTIHTSCAHCQMASMFCLIR